MKPTIFFSEPKFFPPLSFFYGLANSDVWAVLDHARYRPRTNQSQCRLKTADNGIQVLHIAVKPPRNKPLWQMVINNYQPWKKMFLDTITRCYFDSPYYPLYINALKTLINGPCVLLETINIQTTLWVAGLLQINPSLVYTRNFYKHSSKRQVIRNLCHKLKGQQFKLGKVKMEKHISVLDIMFTIGASETRSLLSAIA